MQLKKLATALLFAGVSAQQVQNLTALLTSNDQLSSLVAFLGQYPDIAASLNAAVNITLLAPNNAAIEAFQSSGMISSLSDDAVAAVLNYHVLPGIIPSSDITRTPLFASTALNDTMYTNVTDGQVVECYKEGGDVYVLSGLKAESTVTDPDLKYSGGVVHVIDSVLTIPLNATSTALSADLGALVGGLISTNLISTIGSAADVTIFAPSNQAFVAAGSRLRDLNQLQLLGVLEYHVINGSVLYSSSIVSGQIETLYGSQLNVSVSGGAIFVNEARVINPDILIAGGVMHVIDSVLNPNNTGEANPSGSSPAVGFAGASSANVGDLTSGVPAPSTTVTQLVVTTKKVAQGYTTTGAKATKGGKTTSSGMAPLQTGAVGAAALFGGAALLANW